MKKNFHEISLHEDVSENPPVHCTRCADEYPLNQLVYGCRTGETEYMKYCRNDSCYGAFPSDIYVIEVHCN